MKRTALSVITTSVTIWSAMALCAADFTSGSDGSYGPLNVASNTVLQLPPDGIFKCTTISIETNATLSFARNLLNTPVYLLATGDVVINGTIDVSGTAPPGNLIGGKGGPGGFDGGPGGFVSTGVSMPGGAGLGPGGGKAGVDAGNGAGGGAYATQTESDLDSSDGQTYGSALLIPLIGGSGGGGVNGVPSRGGGGGGGAILVSSSTRISMDAPGSIVSRGGGSAFGNGNVYNGGSGGAVRLVAPRVFGNGLIEVRGALHSGFPATRCGAGRIRIDSLLKYEPTNQTQSLQFVYQPNNVATIGSTMVVFPPNNPRLDILEAAGTTIPEGTGGPVSVVLPFNSDTNRTVVVQARNFNANVPIRVSLIPESGDPTTYDAQIDNSASNPAQATVNVGFPLNSRVNVMVWTR